MPIGCTSLIPYVAQDLFHRRPSSVLDLGMGYGLYGAVVRNYCGDLEPRTTRHTRLVGVEGFPGYDNLLWKLYDIIYDGVTVERYLREASELFDVVLLMDVLEHFDKPEGVDVLERCKQRLNPGGLLWVGTPGIWQEQGAVFGNSLETHRCLWSADELRAAGLEIVLNGSRDTHGNRMLLAKYEGCNSITG